jgi:aspartate kinase
VKIEKGRAIICVVGEGLRSEAGIAAKVFQAVAAQKVSVEMISQGASEINITFVIDQNRAADTVKALHKLFFGS